MLYVLEGAIELVGGVSVVSEVLEDVFDEGVDVSFAEETAEEDFLDDVGVGGLRVLPVVAVGLAHEVVEVEVQRGKLVVDLLDDLVVVGESLHGCDEPLRVGSELLEARLLHGVVGRHLDEAGNLAENEALDDLVRDGYSRERLGLAEDGADVGLFVFDSVEGRRQEVFERVGREAFVEDFFDDEFDADVLVVAWVSWPYRDCRLSARRSRAATASARLLWAGWPASARTSV